MRVYRKHRRVRRGHVGRAPVSSVPWHPSLRSPWALGAWSACSPECVLVAVACPRREAPLHFAGRTALHVLTERSSRMSPPGMCRGTLRIVLVASIVLACASTDPAPSTCPTPTPSCVQGTVGGRCSDELTSARCESGVWRCAPGEVFASQCACIGLPMPGCTCARTGWVCPDAGVHDVTRGNDTGGSSDVTGGNDTGGASDAGGVDGTTDAGCTGRPAGCVSGTVGGACGDVVVEPVCVAGTWTCPRDWIFLSECACVGRPPGRSCMCTPSGWSCPDAGTDL